MLPRHKPLTVQSVYHYITYLCLAIDSVPSQASHLVSHLDLIARVGEEGVISLVHHQGVLCARACLNRRISRMFGGPDLNFLKFPSHTTSLNFSSMVNNLLVLHL